MPSSMCPPLLGLALFLVSGLVPEQPRLYQCLMWAVRSSNLAKSSLILIFIDTAPGGSKVRSLQSPDLLGCSQACYEPTPFTGIMSPHSLVPNRHQQLRLQVDHPSALDSLTHATQWGSKVYRFTGGRTLNSWAVTSSPQHPLNEFFRAHLRNAQETGLLCGSSSLPPGSAFFLVSRWIWGHPLVQDLMGAKYLSIRVQIPGSAMPVDPSSEPAKSIPAPILSLTILSTE